VDVTNGNQPAGLATSLTPGKFALFDPLAACFYDFFESGASKWQLDGNWDIVTIAPGGERAMTDSPAGPYKNAGDYGEGLTTFTTHITSVPFDLSNCPNPVLIFRHDFIMAKVGDSQDTGRVEISTDNGLTWTPLISYTGGGVFGLNTQESASTEWATPAWKDAIIDLGAFSGIVQLRFSLQVDGGASDKGWVLDDLVVGEQLSQPLAGPIYLPIMVKN
jgi:hypothetical protein